MLSRSTLFATLCLLLTATAYSKIANNEDLRTCRLDIPAGYDDLETVFPFFKNPTGRPKAPAQDPFVAVLPFQLVGNLIAVTAKVNDREGLFILDSGSASVLLNKRLFQKDQVRKRSGEFFSSDVAGSSSNLERIVVHFQIKNLAIKGQEAFLMDLSGLEENKNIPVLGIIGFNFLSRFEVVTDYQKREITFFTLDGKGNRKSDASLHNDPTETIPLKKNRHLFFLEAELEEGTLKLGLDTGAEATVISKGAAEKIRSWFVPSTPVSIVAYNGKMETVNTGKVLQVVIGETMLDLPRVLLVDLSSLNRYMIKSLDGILGFDFFSAYKTAVNYKAGSLSIWSNAQWLVGE